MIGIGMAYNHASFIDESGEMMMDVCILDGIFLYYC